MISLVEEKINWVIRNIDKSYFDQARSEKFGINISPQPGKSSDLDINYDIFNNFNNNFKKIEKNKWGFVIF